MIELKSDGTLPATPKRATAWPASASIAVAGLAGIAALVATASLLAPRPAPKRATPGGVHVLSCDANGHAEVEVVNDSSRVYSYLVTVTSGEQTATATVSLLGPGQAATVKATPWRGAVATCAITLIDQSAWPDGAGLQIRP